MAEKLVVSQIEKRRRGFFGILVAVAFWAFNAGMLVLLLRTWVISAAVLEVEEVRGWTTFVGTVVVLCIWLFGAAILGIMMFATRGRKVIMNLESKQ